MGTLAISLLAITGPAGAAAVGYWHFDTGFADSSAFGSNLDSPIGGVAIVRNGLIDGAFSFSGTGFLLSSSALLTASRTTFTMAAFVTATGNPGSDAPLLGNFFENPALVFRAGLTDHFGARSGPGNPANPFADTWLLFDEEGTDDLIVRYPSLIDLINNTNAINGVGIIGPTGFEGIAAVPIPVPKPSGPLVLVSGIATLLAIGRRRTKGTCRRVHRRLGRSLSCVAPALVVAAFSSAALADVTVSPDSPNVSNCFPFGAGDPTSWPPNAAFIYKNIPAFNLASGDTLAFDLGAVNDANIQLDIAMAPTTVNGGDVNDGAFTTVATNSQTPLNPTGDTVVGNFELQWTAESSFSFAGGGLIIRFSNPAGSFAADNSCTQVLVNGDSTDTSGFFVKRAFRDVDGVSPWISQDSSFIGGFQIVTTGCDTSIFEVCDGEFANADWSHEVLVDTAGGGDTISGAGQVLTGGNPDRRQFGSHVWLAPGLIIEGHFFGGGVYDPAIDGAITSMAATVDARVDTVSGGANVVNVGLIARQNGNDFTALLGQSILGGGWTTHRVSRIDASSFSQVSGSGALDVSAGGAPIQFGYFSSGGVANAANNQWDVDNFGVSINEARFEVAFDSGNDNVVDILDYHSQSALVANLGASTVTGITSDVAFRGFTWDGTRYVVVFDEALDGDLDVRVYDSRADLEANTPSSTLDGAITGASSAFGLAFDGQYRLAFDQGSDGTLEILTYPTLDDLVNNTNSTQTNTIVTGAQETKGLAYLERTGRYLLFFDNGADGVLDLLVFDSFGALNVGVSSSFQPAFGGITEFRGATILTDSVPVPIGNTTVMVLATLLLAVGAQFASRLSRVE